MGRYTIEMKERDLLKHVSSKTVGKNEAVNARIYIFSRYFITYLLRSLYVKSLSEFIPQ